MKKFTSVLAFTALILISTIEVGAKSIINYSGVLLLNEKNILITEVAKENIHLKEAMAAVSAPVATAAEKINSTSFQANWNAVNGVDGYKLYVYTKGRNSSKTYFTGFNPKTIQGSGTNKFVVSGLNMNTTYYYVLKAVVGKTESDLSNIISLKTLVSAPAAPVAITASNITATSFQANWEASVGATGYKLFVLGEIEGQPGSYSHVDGYNAKEVTGSSFVIPENTLEPGVNHYYFLTANNSTGESVESNSITVKTISPTPLALAATNITSTSFQANWEISVGAIGYRVSVRNDFLQEYISEMPIIVEGGLVTNCMVTELESDVPYSYYVQAINESGTSSFMNIIELRTLNTKSLVLSASPVEGGTVSGDDSVEAGSSVTASAVPNPGYAFVNWTQDGTEVSTDINYTFTLVENTTLVGNFVAKAPAIPVIIGTSSIMDSSFYASWEYQGNTTEYTLTVYQVNEGGEKVYLDDYNPKILNSNYNGTHVLDLTPLATYYWYLQAVNVTGTSEKSEIQTVTTKMSGTSSLTITDITSTSCEVSWSPVAGVVTYYLWVQNSDDTYLEGFGPKDVTTNSYSLKGLTPGSEYYISVSAVFISGESAKTSAYKVNTSRHTLTLSANPAVGGFVDVDYTYVPEKQATLQATTNDGYVFVNWTEDGTEVSTEPNYTFTLNTDRTLVANFQLRTGIYDEFTTHIKVWPNPISSSINISEIPNGSSIKLASLLGQVFIQKNDCNSLEKLNVEFLTSGIYILVIENGHTHYSQKIIKR